MREILLGTLLVLSNLTSYTQITIDMDDMPQAGERYAFSTSNALGTGLDPAETGAGFFWDYSSLADDASGVDTMFMISETPVLYQFFFNNPFFYPDHVADLAIEGQGVNLGAVSISDVFTYHKNDSEGYKNVGFGANVNMLPSSVQNVPIDVVFEFPLDFEDSTFSHSEAELTLPGFGYYHHDQDRSVEVEGWGSLVLPDSTYSDVLKVKSIVTATDSVYSEQFMIGFAIPQPEVVTYQWLTPGGGLPILEISIAGGFGTTIKYRSELVSGLNSYETEYLEIYPNPTSDFLNLSHIVELSSLGAVRIVDVSGREVMLLEQASSLIDVRQLRNGRYYLVIEGEERIYSAPFSKE